MNLNGIAIASDTVATNQSDSGAKTTTNSEKIYTLGSKHNIVAMHYGSTGLNDLHHQFHFNRWVETLGEPFATLTDYVFDYVKFAEQGPKFHSPESELVEIRYLLRNHYQYLRQRMIDEAPRWADDDLTPDDERSVAHKNNEHRIMQEAQIYLNTLEPFPGVDEAWALEVFKKLNFKPKDLWSEVFEGFNFEAKVTRALNKQAAQVIVRQQEMPWDSYLAFVGYGAEDAFGANVTLVCRSLIDGKFLAAAKDLTQVGPGQSQAEISQFAQYDAISAFLRGYNNDIRAGYNWAIGKHVAEAMGDEPDWAIINQIQEKVAEYVDGHSWRTYVQPILKRIAGMNNHALGQLAQTLVQIQATSSEATDGPASVGGLIEVLTIDRINGIQWKVRLPQ